MLCCAARQTSGLASEAFGHNASQLEASLRASGQSVGSGYAPRGMEDDRFSVNASFSYQHSPAVGLPCCLSCLLQGTGPCCLLFRAWHQQKKGGMTCICHLLVEVMPCCWDGDRWLHRLLSLSDACTQL